MEAKTLYSYFLRSSCVTTDTRKIEKGSFFFCLKGENFNGNKFAEEALQKGAAFVLVDDLEYHRNKPQYIIVDDCLKSLQDLAKYHRKQFNIPVIGLTGSNGKTTTKELINSVLSEQFKTIATIGNLNNHIGVPLTLLNINSKTEIVLIEMGANHLNEIDFLANITAPTHGLITNFGKAHLEGFGSIDGVIKGKSELYRYLAKKKGVAFINSEELLQIELTKNQEVFSFGNQENVDLVIHNNPNKYDGNLEILIKGMIIKSQLKGSYNYPNIKTAAAFGYYFKIPLEKIKNGIEKYIPNNNRSHWYKTDSNTLILDSYNANPSSMKAALDSFIYENIQDKILILGDMHELGTYAKEEHQKTVDFISQKRIKNVILIGSEFEKTEVKDINFIKFKTTNDAIPYLKKKNFQNKTILIKGSRGIALEGLQNYL